MNGPVRVLEAVETAAVATVAPLARNEDALAAEPAAVLPGPRARMKGKCGQRLGERIDGIVQYIRGPVITPEDEWPSLEDDEPLGLDELLAEIRHQSSCESTCCAAPEPLPVEITSASEDPPALARGGGAERAPDASAVGGDGFSNQQASVWDAFSGRPDCINDTSDFLKQIDEEPRLRASAMLRTLDRVRAELEAMPEQSALDAPVCVSLQDALVLMTQLMQKLR